MCQIFASLLNIYMVYLNFCSNINSSYNKLKTWTYDGSVVYHGYFDDTYGYRVIFNNDKWYYVFLYAIMKLFNLHQGCLIPYTHVVHITGCLNVVTYIRKGQLHGDVIYHNTQDTRTKDMQPLIETPPAKTKDETSEIIAEPVANDELDESKDESNVVYVIINGTYNVTEEFNLFRKSLIALGVKVLAFEVMQVLLSYQRRNMKPLAAYLARLTIMYKDTLEEQTLKANEIFEFKNGQ